MEVEEEEEEEEEESEGTTKKEVGSSGFATLFQFDGRKCGSILFQYFVLIFGGF
uniref:Uncharacterized protein n=1 Tax=Nelumbo nucifera TaxID=4432 RepID=A0A822ZEA4_NELNU|nr:TPA_asm: hypothetical protein HUJ06_016102 [Nelumbo nucifera]